MDLDKPKVYGDTFISDGLVLLIIVATGVYALLLKFLQKNSPHNVQTNGGGGGGQRLFEQCSKKLHFSLMTASLILNAGIQNERGERFLPEDGILQLVLGNFD